MGAIDPMTAEEAQAWLRAAGKGWPACPCGEVMRLVGAVGYGSHKGQPVFACGDHAAATCTGDVVQVPVDELVALREAEAATVRIQGSPLNAAYDALVARIPDGR